MVIETAKRGSLRGDGGNPSLRRQAGEITEVWEQMNAGHAE
jgi:hypothetical protein